MNQLLKLLKGGDLRSDGAADEVVQIVLEKLELFPVLLQGLEEQDEVVRGRTADALEKIARRKPGLLIEHLHTIINSAMDDHVAMVKWHMAMILGYLSTYENKIKIITDTLFDLLKDPAVFVKSWVMVSLCIIGRKYPGYKHKIIKKLLPYQQHHSIAIRSKTTKTLDILVNDDKKIPAGWIKSVQLREELTNEQ